MAAKTISTIRIPDAFRGLDNLVEHVSKIMSRYPRKRTNPRKPVHASVQKSA